MYNVNEEKETVVKMTVKNIMWSIYGIIMGMTIDITCKKINKKLKINREIVNVLIQLILCSVVLSIFRIKLLPYFGWSWQNITPGLFFVSFFFGSQFFLFSNVQNIIHYTHTLAKV